MYLCIPYGNLKRIFGEMKKKEYRRKMWKLATVNKQTIYRYTYILTKFYTWLLANITRNFPLWTDLFIFSTIRKSNKKNEKKVFLKVYLHVYGSYIHSTEHTEEVPKNLSIDKKNVYTPKLYPSFCKLIALKIVEVHSNHGNNNFRYFFTFFGVFPYKLETNITPIAMHIYFHSDFFFFILSK